MAQPPEPVFFDARHPCAYLPDQMARLPYRRPAGKLRPTDLDQRLAEGDRRNGIFLYRTECPACQACQSLRLEVASFRPDATQRRMQRRGESLLQVVIGEPVVDSRRVQLFNQHRDGRELAADDVAISKQSYAEFLTESCCQTQEFAYWHEDRLVAVAIADLGQESLSAVYCYFDPEFRLLSLGTYSILRQVQFCRETNRRYLYLGFFIAQSRHMVYKSRFLPHERLIGGRWTTFSK